MDLCHVNWSGRNLQGINFKGANLSGADLSKANLRGANFTNADITYANFTDANVEEVIFKDALTMGTIGLALPKRKLPGSVDPVPAPAPKKRPASMSFFKIG